MVYEQETMEARGADHDEEEKKKQEANKKNPKRGGFYYFTLSNGETVKLPAITSILGVLNKPFLVNWAAKKAAEIACEHPYMSIDDITSKFRADNVMAASTRGKGVHNIWEKMLKGETYTTIPAYSAYIEPLEAFLKENKVQSVLLSEQPIKSFKLGIAGTLDALVVINEKVILLDLKTSNSTYPEHFLQLETYKVMIEEDTGTKVDDAFILHVPGNGKYSIVRGEGNMAIVNHLKAVYMWKEGL